MCYYEIHRCPAGHFRKPLDAVVPCDSPGFCEELGLLQHFYMDDVSSENCTKCQMARAEAEAKRKKRRDKEAKGFGDESVVGWW